MDSLIKLPITQFSGLDYDNVIKDVYNLIQENPEYNSNWDDFLSSSAGRMLMELFAYIADQLATRIDWNVNENFLSTATQDSSILKLLKLINYKLALPYCAAVPVTLYFNKASNKELVLTPAYTELSGTRNDIFTIDAFDNNKVIKNFEAISYDAINNKFLYKNKVSVNLDSDSYNSVFTLNFYEGLTKVEQFISTTQDNEIFTLSNSSVINNSVAVFMKQSNNNINSEIELLKVDSFLSNEAQDENNAIPYMVNILENGSVTVEFAPKLLMNNIKRLLPVGSTLYIFYRVGGGSSCNIPIKSINLNKTLTFNDETYEVNMINESSGYGGTDLETINHAALYGPLTLKTANKAVTTEDYKILLSNNPLVLKSVSFGGSNMPSDFYKKYGYYINSNEVYTFIALNKNYSGLKPSQYNNFKWIDTKLENRFNELYSFSDSKFNFYGYFFTDIAEQTTLNYKTGVNKTFHNYIIINTTDDFKEKLGITDENGDFIPDNNLQLKVTKAQTEELFFRNIDNYFINAEPYILGTVDDVFYDTVTEDTSSVFYSTVGVANTTTDTNNVYGFDISSKYSIGLDIDGRGMIIVNLKDDYAANDNKKIYLSNSTPLIKPPSGTYYNTLYEARYHKGIVEKINNAFKTNINYGSAAKPIQFLGLTLEDTSQAQAFGAINHATDIPLTINGTTYNISYGGVGRTSQYYSDIVTYINQDLLSANSGIVCEFYQLINGSKDIRFSAVSAQTISVEKTPSMPMDMLYYLYNNISMLPPEASNGGDYSNVASVVVDSTDGKSYLKIISPSTGKYSSLQFKVSDFKNNLNNSVEFMDILGVKYNGNTSLKVTGKKSLTLVTNKNDINFGNFIYETNVLGKNFGENNYLFIHAKEKEIDSLVIGSVYTNFYSENPEVYKEANKAHYVYSTVLGKNKLPIMEECNFQVAFTKNKTSLGSIEAIKNDGDIIYIYPYDFVELTTIDLGIIDTTENYFNSNDILKFSIDDGELITIQLSTIGTVFELKSALQNAFVSLGYINYLDYIYEDFDNSNVLHIHNKKRNPSGNIYFPSVPDTNLFFEKIFGTPSQNNLKLKYREEITQHPLGENYIEITNHPYIDSNYSPTNGVFTEIRFDCRIKDETYYGGYRTPDFYYDFDEEERVFIINKVNGNLIPDSEFYLHFINDKRYDQNGNPTANDNSEENLIKNYLDKYKISGIENKVLPANFATFDVAANIVCKDGYSLETIKFGLEEALRNEYSLSNIDFDTPIAKSKIFSTIQNYTGVSYAEITYFGLDYTKNNSNLENRIESNFDTITVLCEDVFDDTGNKIHGLIFNYSYAS